MVLMMASCGREADPASRAVAEGPTPGVEVQVVPTQVPDTQVIFETPGGEVRATLEVVFTPAKIQRGLMHRRHLAPDRGMLFIFSGDRVRSFWMKNTLIPLDMLFVRANMTVAGIERDTVPLSTDPRSVGIETRYVIEVNGGWTAAHGIEAGTRLRFENLPELTSQPPL